ncbi:alpha-ketoglutarate-dependent dioxygenase AlkB [Gammaproteobacteria bacterium]|nr:alpha-ketoglutarate-dependent dioxygenase AlkB [Gammaproteobacteria bacterium]MDC0091817.1 alpha-ketoglutarate-dependent dioxygenase AlkB [Gammaproteobacteria bacterium]MDC1300432.1 alpha-ketoglutarate-dependent dioxygenase AlkB [Gammaproteobacteria bacterium]
MQNEIVAHNDLKIRVQEGFFSSVEANDLLINCIAGLPWESMKIKMFGKEVVIPRLQCWVGDKGCEYSYSGKKLNRQPWTPELLMIKEKISQHANLNFNSVLVNFYRDGQDSMGWHADDEPELGKNPTIAALSFGGERDLVFRNILSKETLSIPQLHGALIIIDGQTQQYWQHAIKKTKKVISPRINLTFRNIMFEN